MLMTGSPATDQRLTMNVVLDNSSARSVSESVSSLENNEPLRGRVESWACCPVFSPCMLMHDAAWISLVVAIKLCNPYLVVE
jgi:hypothetical protein